MMNTYSLKTKTFHDLLFHLTRKILSSIDVDQVLEVVSHHFSEYYADIEIHIWLSHDFNHRFPVKYLNFQEHSKDQNTEAYLKGESVLTQVEQNKLSLSIPFKGKQASYGVFQCSSVNHALLIENKEMLLLIADTVGIALENAQLFQQSQKLIQELKLINETTQELNRSLHVDYNVNSMMDKLLKNFNPHGVYFLTFFQTPRDHFKVYSKTDLRVHGKILPLLSDSYISRVIQGKESILICDLSEDTRAIFGPDYPISNGSLMITPMFNQNQKVIGLIVLTHTSPNGFSYDQFRLLKSFTQHASFSFVNSLLHEDLNRLVITDTLTRLYTRNYLDQEVIFSLKKDRQGSFILIDIDDFKRVNDSYGHQVGDDILIQVANVIKSSIRENDIASRWGGEELAIYLPNINIENAYEIAERIRYRVRKETSPPVTISCGLSEWKEQDILKSMEVLFQFADQKLYKAKRSGKNKAIMQA